MLNLLAHWHQNRRLKPFRVQLEKVNALEDGLRGLSEVQLRDRTALLKADLQAGAKLAAIIPQALAVAREASRRVLGRRPYDTQILGALMLIKGAVTEMATGEGKTLVAPLAAYVAYLQSKPVHIVTANEFLALRDASAMSSLYAFLGMSVGVLLPGQTHTERKYLYGLDVVYSTHQTLVMDYLTDSLLAVPGLALQSRRAVAIVDEADSVLIDDARTPIVLPDLLPANESVYAALNGVAQSFVRAADAKSEGDFWIDGKARQAVLTDVGYEKANAMLRDAGLLRTEGEGLYEDAHQQLLVKLTNALAVNHVLFNGQHYLVQDGRIILIDPLTGRLLPGRTWDSGIQQALESKEHVALSPETVVRATITIQNYFKGYELLSGMSGTALTDEDEFLSVYGLEVFPAPSNKPSQRQDLADKVFQTLEDKFNGVLLDIVSRHQAGQPVLVGTASVTQSERISQRLSELGVVHEVINAKQHDREAEILAMAGMPGAVTVATNMAGRGVDIVLGGNPGLDLFRAMHAVGEERWAQLSDVERERISENVHQAQQERAELVRRVGGLHVIGYERYDSRRMDNQLRGRAGRQGDPGSTQFYISKEDPLVESFAGEQLRTTLTKLDVQPGTPDDEMVVRQFVDAAQRELEGVHNGARKNMLQYDDVLNEQREAIFQARLAILNDARDGFSILEDKLQAYATEVLDNYVGDLMAEEWRLDLVRELLAPFSNLVATDKVMFEWDNDQVYAEVLEKVAEAQQAAWRAIPAKNLNVAARAFALNAIDERWMDHLQAVAALRQGIHLRAYAQQDPQRAFKLEAFALFERMLEELKANLALLTPDPLVDEHATSAES